MRHLLSKGASPNTSDDEVLLQLALYSAPTQCSQQEHKTPTWGTASTLRRFLRVYWQKDV